MTPFEKLVAHLKNLQSKKVQKVTLDVEWLMSVLKVMPIPVEVNPKKSITAAKSSGVEIDGGGFND